MEETEVTVECPDCMAILKLVTQASTQVTKDGRTIVTIVPKIVFVKRHQS